MDQSSPEAESEESDDKSKLALDETYDRKRDWYVSSLKKSTIFKILFVIKDLLGYKSEPAKGEFYNKVDELRAIKENFVEELGELGWERIRGVTKAMWRKRKTNVKEDNMHKFEGYKELAKSLFDHY